MTDVCAPAGEHLSLEHLFDVPQGRRILSCLQCGTCSATCPYGDVMEYPPRRIVGLLREGMLDRVLHSDSLLMCVACYACMAKCPRDIALTEVLLPLVKEQVFVNLPETPAELGKALQNTLRYGNPMGEPARKRAAWVKTAGVPVRILQEDPRPVDVLWNVECYNAYHPRGQDTSRATARVLTRLGIDFAILGNEEKCAGECARLLGETGLFDTLMDYNMAVLQKYRFNRLVTSGAHAYDAYKYQYPALGFRYPLESAPIFVARHLDRLRPMLGRLPLKVTYHDSCCLGRHNGFYDEPRALLRAIPGVRLVEMVHNRQNSLCCGGGGGGMWLDTYYKAKGYMRLSDRRVAEAVATGADVLAVACPYEVSRFEDALKLAGAETKIAVKDVLELVAESMEATS